MTLKNLGLLLLVFILPAAALGQRSEAPTLPYEKAAVWPAPPKSAVGAPGIWNFIEASGVTMNAAGNILVLHRGAHPILEFQSNGEFVRSFGDGLFSEGKVFALAPEYHVAGQSTYTAVYGPAGCTSCGAHSIRLDPEGSVWVVNATGHVVSKLNEQGQVVMQLGTNGVSGGDEKTFNLPTDVAFAPNGDIYVTDGYASQRIVRFSKDGKYLLSWGRWGTGPGQFYLPHNLAIDEQGRVYVTDRENRRVEVFEADGTFLKQWTTSGRVSALYMTKDQQLWVGDELYDLDGKLLGRLPEFSGGSHGIVATPGGDVYLAQLGGAVVKFVKR